MKLIWRFLLGRYVCTNFVQVSVEEEFFDLPKDTILSLLASEDLRVDSEYQVFLAAMNWLYHNVGSRRRYTIFLLCSTENRSILIDLVYLVGLSLIS